MGKINAGILGAFSGSVGPIVGSTWKGTPVIRSKPSRKRGRSTEGQLRQMAKLKLMTPFLRPLSGFLNGTYGGVTVRMSCFNKALSLNMRNAISGEYPDLRIHYPRVLLGVGDLMNPENIIASSESAGQMRISWTDNSGDGSARATDRVFVAIYCEDMNRWVTSLPGPQRNAGSCLLEAAAFKGKAVQTYIGFLSADKQFVFTSQYAGQTDML